MHEIKFISVKLFFVYILEKVKRDNEELTYKIFMSDRINILAQDKKYETAPSFYDLIKKEKNTDNRTAEEIKQDLLLKNNGGR